MCVAVEPKVITKVIEIDETAPMGPAMYPPYWGSPVPVAGQVPQLQAGEGAEETDKMTETIERRKRDRKRAGSPAKVFEDNMMDYVREKPKKDEDDKDDDRRKKKKKKKQKRKRQKKKKRKPKRQRQKRRKQKKKQRKRRQRRKKRQQKRRQ